MNKIFILITVCFCFSAVCFAAGEDVAEVKVGGVSINVPPPADGFKEVGYDKREFLEIAVPPNNRLLSAFLTEEDLKKFGTEQLEYLSRYMMLQVARGAEYMSCGPEDFKIVIESMSEAMSQGMKDTIDEANAEISRRLKALNVDEVKLDKPEMLGQIFSITDAAAFAMVMSVKEGARTTKMICGLCTIRVKSKLLFAYVYSEYKDEASVDWVCKTTENWAKALLNANQ
ncbi:hypothetical protein M0R36_08180 [bacterium]|jgi:hypothetical protein|nr:hypothetical protein [bacterium]